MIASPMQLNFAKRMLLTGWIVVKGCNPMTMKNACVAAYQDKVVDLVVVKTLIVVTTVSFVVKMVDRPQTKGVQELMIAPGVVLMNGVTATRMTTSVVKGNAVSVPVTRMHARIWSWAVILFVTHTVR